MTAPMRSIDDGDAWDDHLRTIPQPHLLQSHAWGEFKSRWGWSTHRFAWGNAEAPEALAQVLVRRVARLPFVVAYIPKGPLLARRHDASLWRFVLGDLVGWARMRGVTYLKIDPDVPTTDVEVAEGWRRSGWHRSDDDIQFPNTMISDLSQGEAALWAAMKPKTRYNIGLSERRGVTVRTGGHDDLATFYRLYVETGARGGFGVRSYAYYADIWSTWLDQGQAGVLLAEHGGKALAGVIPVRFGHTAWYLYGASTPSGRDLMPSYAAQWASLKWAIQAGCTVYDWWGGPTVLAEEDPLWGVYRFKQGFGAQWVEQVGAWDFPLNRAAYTSYLWLNQWRRRWIARRL